MQCLELTLAILETKHIKLFLTGVGQLDELNSWIPHVHDHSEMYIVHSIWTSTVIGIKHSIIFRIMEPLSSVICKEYFWFKSACSHLICFKVESFTLRALTSFPLEYNGVALVLQGFYLIFRVLVFTLLQTQKENVRSVILKRTRCSKDVWPSVALCRQMALGADSKA